MDYFTALADLGIDTVIVDNQEMNFYDPDMFALWATEVIPAVHAIPVRGR